MPLIWHKIDPTLLHQPFRDEIEKLFSGIKATFYGTEGLRTPERSDELYKAYKEKKGPRAAPAGLSAHNWGLAIDVALDGDDVKPGLQMSWDTKMAGWLELKAMLTVNQKLSGGFMYADWPHIEFKGWKGWRELRNPTLFHKLYG